MLGALAPIRQTVQFTIFQTGLTQLVLLGFITMSLFAGLTYILPRAFELEWPRATSGHFTFTLVGALLVAVPLLIGGLVQGAQAANAQTNYLDVARGTMKFTGMALIGLLVMLVGQFLFLRNIGSLVCGACCNRREGGRA